MTTSNDVEIIIPKLILELKELNTIIQYPLDSDILLSYAKSIYQLQPSIEPRDLKEVIFMYKLKAIIFDKTNSINDIINALKVVKELRKWLFKHNISLPLEKRAKIFYFIKIERTRIYTKDKEKNFKIQNNYINNFITTFYE